ncbi:MAG: tetratricopeptide repeat protein [Saprospiraceae bacterium]
MDQLLNHTIRRYLTRQMSPVETRSFEQRLAAEPALVLELSAYEALLLHRDQTLRARLIARSRQRAAGQTAGTLSARTGGRQMYRWAAAAGLALLVTAIGFWYNSSSARAGRIYASHYQPLEISAQLGGGQPTPEQVTWQEAVQAYERHDYATTLAKASQASQLPDYQDQAYLLIGASYLETGRAPEAIPVLQQLGQKVRRNYEKALFYLALAYLQQKETGQARTTLEQLAALRPTTPLVQEATDMLKELK